jgi:hypothetical protein
MLKCFFCDNPADRIGYYSKFYHHSNLETIENPTLYCFDCWNSPNRNEISQVRGGSEGVYCFLFTSIGEWTNKKVAWYTNKKGWERNDLANLGMRKLMWRIKFRFTPRKDKDDSVSTPISQ